MRRVARRVDDDVVALGRERPEGLVDDARCLERAAALQREVATLEHAFSRSHALPDRARLARLMTMSARDARGPEEHDAPSALTPGSARSRAGPGYSPWRRTSDAAADGD